MKYFNSNIFLKNTNNNIHYNYADKNKSFRPNKKFIKYSLNNALNFKSFEYYLINNTSKRIINAPPEKKLSNDINRNKERTEPGTNIYNNNNISSNITKKSLGNLKGTPYLENLFTENTKPILINTSCARKNTEVNTRRKKKNLSNNRKMNNNKIKVTNSNKNSKSKNKNKKQSLSYKMNHISNKDNIDNNIMINFNILKPNISLDHQK